MNLAMPTGPVIVFPTVGESEQPSFTRETLSRAAQTGQVDLGNPAVGTGSASKRPFGREQRKELPVPGSGV